MFRPFLVSVIERWHPSISRRPCGFSFAWIHKPVPVFKQFYMAILSSIRKLWTSVQVRIRWIERTQKGMKIDALTAKKIHTWNSEKRQILNSEKATWAQEGLKKSSPAEGIPEYHQAWTKCLQAAWRKRRYCRRPQKSVARELGGSWREWRPKWLQLKNKQSITV